MRLIEISDEAYRALEPYGDPGQLIEVIALDGVASILGSALVKRHDGRTLPVNFLESATQCGLLDGGSDYAADQSSNPAYLDGFGQ